MIFLKKNKKITTIIVIIYRLYHDLVVKTHLPHLRNNKMYLWLFFHDFKNLNGFWNNPCSDIQNQRSR